MHKDSLSTNKSGDIFGYILNNYQYVKQDREVKQDIQSKFSQLITLLEPHATRVGPTIKLDYGIGVGSIANVPWLALLDSRITNTTQSGIYCVYLFKADMSGVYLTFNQGVGRKEGIVPNKARLQELQSLAETIRLKVSSLRDFGFSLDNKINLADSGQTGKAYEKSTIAYKYYPKGELPSDQVLIEDLENVLNAYQNYIAFTYKFPENDTTAKHINESNDVVTKSKYSAEFFSKESGYSLEKIQEWLKILLRKKQIIIQGPPGTGKTYLAERLARILVAEPNGFSDLVQFHPAYGYEDFIQGYFPRSTDGVFTFEAKKGIFLQFCDKASAVDNAACVLIIDEINRANLARVFGELMYLLEYRDQKISLATGEKPFSIPSNVYIIGTMNTADRSIALVDHALRRRFSFIRIKPEYALLEQHLKNQSLKSDGLVSVLRRINAAINDQNYEIGISFFLSDIENLPSNLRFIWTTEIEPYLEEYFFDDLSKVEPFRWSALSLTDLSDYAR